MANTYTQVHIHCVMAVKYRSGMIDLSWKERLHQYITGVIQNHGHKMLAINSMPDHLHLFFGFRPSQSLSDLMRIVKSESSEWINKEKLALGRFAWQEGYGAFSYSQSQVQTVINYVMNQEEHHRKRTFLEEYQQFLDQFEVEFDQRFIFKQPE